LIQFPSLDPTFRSFPTVFLKPIFPHNCRQFAGRVLLFSRFGVQFEPPLVFFFFFFFFFFLQQRLLQTPKFPVKSRFAFMPESPLTSMLFIFLSAVESAPALSHIRFLDFMSFCRIFDFPVWLDRWLFFSVCLIFGPARVRELMQCPASFPLL